MFHSWHVLRAFKGGTRMFLLVCALDAFGYFGIQGVLLNLYLLRLGFGSPFIGLLIASGQCIWAITALPAGAIGRHASGSRPMARGGNGAALMVAVATERVIRYG